MNVSEAFLVNTKNFESIIDALVDYDADEPVINSSLLEILGYSDPNDLLVVRLLKDFNIIDNNGEPSTYFEEFQNPKTTKRALAKGLLDAYEQLFEKNPKIHQASPDDIKGAFEELFDGKKTDLIIKYISGTFQKVVQYTGVKNIDAVLNEENQSVESAVVSETSVNGAINENNQSKKLIRESLSDKNIDDLVNEFDAKKNSEFSAPKKDDELDLTINEYVKDETKENDDDPFGLGDQDAPSVEQSKEEKTIDTDPIDLDASLSSLTNQPAEPMETLATEKNFVQKALIRKSDLLHKMHRWDDLLPTLEEIIKRYDDEHEFPNLREAVSRSIIRRAVTLLKLNRSEEALPALNTVIDRFKESEIKEYYDQASKAMLHKAQILEMNEGSDLLPLYNTIIDRLDSDSEILIKEKLDRIHLKRFDLIIKKGTQNDILEASEGLINRFKGREEHREYLQLAMMKRAEILDELGRDEDALKAYDEFLAAFGD
ncbi:MAG: DUF5343 domain-containing protein [Balneolaceae bacterium]|jgi:hypothetical protein